MLIGVGLFLAGSILCGFAWSMPALIAFRALQGIGAGSVQPMAMTIIGDIYSVAERAKVQGYVASVWAVSSVVGPTLGGLFVDFLNWRWIFFVNVPLGAAAVWMLRRRFVERVERKPHRIDYGGAVLLIVGASLSPRSARGRRALAVGIAAERRHPRRRCCVACRIRLRGTACG